MTLLLLHDWSARQIADHYQLSAETVKSHIRRSLPLLRIAFLDRHPALKSELDAYILTLPPASQQAMKLFLILGANYQKIAQQLGSPHTPETVKACIEQQRPSLFQLLLTQAS
jgi:DNA-directed RNA polymerase specialized sigma24 family protein